MRNIIITGGELFNKGAQAMTFATVNELKKRFPDHRIYLLSEQDLMRPEAERKQYAFDFMGWYPIKFARCQKKPLMRALLLLKNGKELREAEAIYRNTDLMVDISGYALGSNWSAKNCHWYLDHIEFAQSFDIPMYLMPQSFGPFDFTSEEGRDVDARIRGLLPGVRMICVREQEGYDALVSRYGLRNVRLMPDIVLSGGKVELNSIFMDVPQLELPEIAEKAIGLVPNARNADIGDGNAVLALYRQIIPHLVQSGNTVYLLSHSTHDTGICKAIKADFEKVPQVVLLEKEYSCLEFNEIVKQFRYLIGSRFHSIVHAYKNGIPCIVLGWATKYHDLLGQFGQEKYMFDVRDECDADAILSAIERMEENREAESAKILHALQNVRKDCVFDILSL